MGIPSSADGADGGDKRFVNATGSTMHEIGVSIGKQQKESIAQM